MLVVFLGNPGSQYSKTRHNSGFMLADELECLKNVVWIEKFNGKYAKAEVNGKFHYFLKPMTFMNLSGKSVAAAKSFFKLNNEDIIVAHDDIETDFEIVNIKKSGGFAGHNGLKSIANTLGDNNFIRLRIGVGRPNRGDVSSFVLGRFTLEEEIVLPLIFKKAENLLISYLK